MIAYYTDNVIWFSLKVLALEPETSSLELATKVKSILHPPKGVDTYARYAPVVIRDDCVKEAREWIISNGVPLGEATPAENLSDVTNWLGAYFHHRNSETPKPNPTLDAAQPDDTIRVLATVTSIKQVDTSFGSSTMVCLKAISGHTLKYFHYYKGINPFAGKIGELLDFTAVVSGHSTFRGVQDIIVKRVTLTND